LHANQWRELETELRGVGDHFLFQVEQQLERDVKEVAAAARRVEHLDGSELFLKRSEFVAHRGGFPAGRVPRRGAVFGDPRPAG